MMARLLFSLTNHLTPIKYQLMKDIRERERERDQEGTQVQCKQEKGEVEITGICIISKKNAFPTCGACPKGLPLCTER